MINFEYGVKNPEYTNHAHDVAARLSNPNSNKTGVYTIDHNVYNDTAHTEALQPDAPEDYLNSLVKTNTEHSPIAGKHPNLKSDSIANMLNNPEILAYTKRSAIKNNPNITTEHITKALGDEDLLIRMAAIEHPKASQEHIMKALSDEDSGVRMVATYVQNSRKAKGNL